MKNIIEHLLIVDKLKKPTSSLIPPVCQRETDLYKCRRVSNALSGIYLVIKHTSVQADRRAVA